MATDSSSRIAVFATNRYRAEALSLSISAHSEHDAHALPEASTRVLASFPIIVLELDTNLRFAVNLIHEVTALRPDARIIVVGSVESEECIVQLAVAGATGYVPAKASFQDMLSIIRSARKGEFACPPDLSYSLFRRLAELARNRDADFLLGSGLTTRELQILKLAALNLSNKEIAERLCVSEYTVKNHVHHLLKKLGLHSRRGAAQFLNRSLLTAGA